MSEPVLNALVDPRRGGRAYVSLIFLASCVLVTGLSLIFPPLYSVLGAAGGIRHFWQPFTSALEHGWPGFPALLHLGLNAFLILECGRPCERLLGRWRFLGLSLVALGTNAALQFVTDGVNGSSIVIWAWGPSLFVSLLEVPAENRATATRDRLRGVLVLMYAIVPVLMTFVPYAFGWRGNPLVAFVRANQFHLAATGAGVLVALAWRPVIRARLRWLARNAVARG